MRYQETCFLFRDGMDDFTLWVVDLPEEEVEKIKIGNGVIRGRLDSLMLQIPTLSESQGYRMQMLTKSGKEFVLYSKDMPETFVAQYLHEGCSIRGDLKCICDEITEAFELCQRTPSSQQLG